MIVFPVVFGLVFGVWRGLHPGPLFYYIHNKDFSTVELHQKQWSRFWTLLILLLPDFLRTMFFLVLLILLPNWVLAVSTILGGGYLLVQGYLGTQYQYLYFSQRNIKKVQQEQAKYTTIKSSVIGEFRYLNLYLESMLIFAPLLFILDRNTYLFLSPALFILSKLFFEGIYYLFSFLGAEHRLVARPTQGFSRYKKCVFIRRFFSRLVSKKEKTPVKPSRKKMKKEDNDKNDFNSANNSGPFLFFCQILNITLFIIGVLFIINGISFFFR